MSTEVHCHKIQKLILWFFLMCMQCILWKSDKPQNYWRVIYLTYLFHCLKIVFIYRTICWSSKLAASKLLGKMFWNKTATQACLILIELVKINAINMNITHKNWAKFWSQNSGTFQIIKLQSLKIIDLISCIYFIWNCSKQYSQLHKLKKNFIYVVSGTILGFIIMTKTYGLCCINCDVRVNVHSSQKF